MLGFSEVLFDLLSLPVGMLASWIDPVRGTETSMLMYLSSLMKMRKMVSGGERISYEYDGWGWLPFPLTNHYFFLLIQRLEVSPAQRTKVKKW
jgi:hypothetical protein